jgi:murein DD-endopeptidase MepM/ murein hydrolase activator NlpD
LVFVIPLLFSRSCNDRVAADRIPEPTGTSYHDYFEERNEWLSHHKKIRACAAGGRSFYELLSKSCISPRDIMRITGAIEPFFDLSKIKEGQEIDIWLNEKRGEIDTLALELPPDKTLYVARNGNDFFPTIVPLSKITVPTVITGGISNSFYHSAIGKGLPPDIIMDITDIFAWDIDFLVDIKPGDAFHVIFEKYYRKGECIGHGKVIAVRFVNQKRVFKSFYFTDSKGGSSYYDSSGKSLRKAFLKSPLRYRRISSSFSRRRFHPILKIYRPHYGIDYAAPIGTPVESIGDGRITFIGRKGGYGRYILIRHNHIYETAYGHLSRFAKGLKKGSRVKQGDVIGYVGSSGISTGPHLDFSVRKRGKYINPLKLESTPARWVSEKDKERFHELIMQMEHLWQKEQSS